jgi:predicted ester cyclase
MSTTTESITETARVFFDACETGKGWAVCSAYCQPNASFAAQAEPLADMQTLQQYTEWMKGMLVLMPDGSYAVKSFATDRERNSVCVYAVFSGTHSGEAGPVPPTGKSTSSDYVYVMEFEDGKISHLTKIWNAGWAMRQLGGSSNPPARLGCVRAHPHPAEVKQARPVGRAALYRIRTKAA